MHEIKALLVSGESKYVEFKERYSKSMLKTISAFSNYHDGKVIIGVTDAGVVIGLDNPKEVRLNIENTINDSIKPKPNYEVESVVIENRTVLLFTIYKGYHTPYTIDGKSYKRSDTATVEIDKHEYDELILYGRNLTFETLEYAGGTLEFNRLAQLFADKLGIVNFSDDVLKSLELIQKGHFTNAAAILADKNPFTEIGIDFVSYADQSMLLFKDRISLKAVSAIEQFDTAMLFYKKHINQGAVIKGAYRESFDEVPEEAYREAIANAIIHRDYSRRGNNRVEFFSDRIEITSIGGLPVGISQEEYINGNFSNARNRIIADVFMRCGMIEKMGTGVRRIKNAYRAFSVKPEFKIFENSIQVILPRFNIESHVNESMEGLMNLTAEEEKILNFIKSGNGISRLEVETFMQVGKTKSTNLLNSLMVKKAIIKIGVGKNTLYKAKPGT